MRIGINTLAIVPGKSGGDGTYVRALVRYLAEIDSEDRYFIFVAPWNEALFRTENPHFRLILCNAPQRFTLRAIWEQLFLPILAKRLKLDVFHAPVNVAPIAMPCPVVLTLLEAEPFMFPKMLPPVLVVYWQVMRRASAMRARTIIAISQSSKAELVRYMGLDPARITVVHLGVDLKRFRPRESDAAVALPHRIRAPYFLWTGRAYPRKNLVRLIEAFGRIKECGEPHVLVLVGVRGWGSDEVLSAIAKLAAFRESVVLPGYLSEDELLTLYQHADAFVFPSLHEAFGLPVLEAMASGTPVITSNTTSLPEVAGAAAVLVDPLDVGALAGSLKQIVDSPVLRHDLARKGRERAAAFTWESMACITVATYRKARQTSRQTR